MLCEHHPPAETPRDGGEEALNPAQFSAGKGLSAFWGAFPLNSSLAGFSREMCLYIAWYPQRKKKKQIT